MKLYKYGGYLISNPVFVFYKVLLLFFVFSLFGGGYILFPKEGYYQNYDRVILKRVFLKRYRGADPGFEAMSLIDNKVVRYDNYVDKNFLSNIVGLNEEDRVIEVYWYYTGFLGYLVNERAVLGLVYKGGEIGDTERRYFLIKEKNKLSFKFSFFFCLFVVLVSICSIIDYTLRKMK